MKFLRTIKRKFRKVVWRSEWVSDKASYIEASLLKIPSFMYFFRVRDHLYLGLSVSYYVCRSYCQRKLDLKHYIYLILFEMSVSLCSASLKVKWFRISKENNFFERIYVNWIAIHVSNFPRALRFWDKNKAKSNKITSEEIN